MNYIQILYLCILKQLVIRPPRLNCGCELHSNLVSLHSETTHPWGYRLPCRLWITFKSCIFAFWNNAWLKQYYLMSVVNYIQILYLCILKQPTLESLKQLKSCELHSNLVSLHSETTAGELITLSRSLWITFKSCIFAFWNNWAFLQSSIALVVNYIQILYLCILKQLTLADVVLAKSCELHSNLVSLHSETTGNLSVKFFVELWITFKSCIFAFWNNTSYDVTGS